MKDQSCNVPPLNYATLTARGLRAENEDSIYPAESEMEKNPSLFMVCDGVGGSPGGKMASSLTCAAIAEYFDHHVGSRLCSATDVQAALQQAEEKLRDFATLHPENKGMATTLALLHIHREVVTIAHLGDSRVYHIRNGIILMQTQDHRLAHNGSRNIITRAVKGDGKPATADMAFLKDHKKEDYFLLCSDGILEGIDARFIEVNFSTYRHRPEIILSRMHEICRQRSTDNYSAVIVRYE